MTEPAKSTEDKKVTSYNENLPKALSIQKNKLMIALGKAPEESFSEKMVKDVMKALGSPSGPCQQWEDTIAEELVKTTVWKHGEYHLSKYLDCATIVFHLYCGSGSSPVAMPYPYSHALEYVLTHARQFGEPAKRVFLTSIPSRLDRVKSDPRTAPLSLAFPNSDFMNKVTRLIDALRKTYDETKYRTLNVNATYFALLVLRSNKLAEALKRPQIHANYNALCPWPLDKKLPANGTIRISKFFSRSAALAIAAYLRAGDERTRRAVRATYAQYMEWSGLQLPKLFFNVADMFNIGADELWDNLIFEDTAAVSLMNLATDFYDRHKHLKEDPEKTQNWFPYCRVLEAGYHRNLSVTEENRRICIILLYLSDLKLGRIRSTIGHVQWVASAPYREECEQTARELFEIINIE